MNWIELHTDTVCSHRLSFLTGEKIVLLSARNGCAAVACTDRNSIVMKDFFDFNGDGTVDFGETVIGLGMLGAMLDEADREESRRFGQDSDDDEWMNEED